MDSATLAAVMGNVVPRAVYDGYVEPFNAAMIAAGCTNVNRAAMWCAQIGHESVGLKYMEEIASGAAYEGRRDLGNTQSGDGRRFKGRGPIQLTGRANYGAFSRWCASQGFVDDPAYFVKDPVAVADPRWGFLAASWYWTVARARLNAYADARDIVAATRAINGGVNGLADRTARWKRVLTFGERLLPNTKVDDMANVPQGEWEAVRDAVLKVAGQETRVLSADGHHGADEDDQLGHTVSAHKLARQALTEIAELRAVVEQRIK